MGTLGEYWDNGKDMETTILHRVAWMRTQYSQRYFFFPYSKLCLTSMSCHSGTSACVGAIAGVLARRMFLLFKLH